jgi:GTP pyrophosphokinase
MENVKDIIKLMNAPSEEDIALITKAYDFAKKAHEGHTRYSGEPYFNHLFETARGLAEIGMGPNSVSVGFLHDAIEDVGITSEEIREKFGEEILFLVDGVTKLGTLKYRGAKRHTESLRKLFVATSQDIRVVIIKLMDRRHNMMTLEYVPKNKQRRIALETLDIYAPIADRLGMSRLKRELEDLAFPYVYPKESKEIHTLLKEERVANEKNLEKILKTIKKELGKAKITHFHTENRIKGEYSLFQKLQRKEHDISKIHDISALRIIVPSVDDCYRVLGIVHGMWRPLPGKIKDYIASPKSNGYQSIHTTVFTGQTGTVEVQIRTDQMHREAEFGIASHLTYKDIQLGEKGNSLEWFKQFLPLVNKVMRKSSYPRTEDKLPQENIPSWIKQIADEHVAETAPEEYLNEIKSDFFSYRLFIFTPKGDVIDLPIGATPLDFAYAVHSDIGDHTAGAKINGKQVALDTTLKNGDVVEIITKKSGKPTQKWLDIAKTTLAKRHIRATLQQEKK